MDRSTDAALAKLDAAVERLLPDWERYPRPFLNGLEPDLVVLHPRHGIGVFLLGDERTLKRPPTGLVLAIKREIRSLYCPRRGGSAGFMPLSVRVVFPDISHERAAAEWLGPHDENPIYVGSDALDAAGAGWLLPASTRTGSMTEDLAADLRHWLVEPEFNRELGSAPHLDARQRQFAIEPEPARFRRIQGAAGSGKSLVLAARAAYMSQRGKRVLLVPYNITLVRYLRSLSLSQDGKVNRVTWLHFHAWAARVMWRAGRREEYLALWAQSANPLGAGVADAARRALVESPGLLEYDAILVDEGQDYRGEWWAALRAALAPGGEMVLVADRMQNIYERDASWTKSTMSGSGFTGRWANLGPCYRIPGPMVDLARGFATDYLDADATDLPEKSPQLTLNSDSVRLRWVAAEPDELVEAAIRAIHDQYSSSPSSSEGALAFPDLVVAVDTKEVAADIVQELERKDIKVVHTTDPDDDICRDQKLAFYRERGEVKVTTVNSFKGWEAASVVLVIAGEDSTRARRLLYTGMTRLKHAPAGSALTVVARADAWASFGARWPRAQDAEAPVRISSGATQANG